MGSGGDGGVGGCFFGGVSGEISAGEPGLTELQELLGRSRGFKGVSALPSLLRNSWWAQSSCSSRNWLLQGLGLGFSHQEFQDNSLFPAGGSREPPWSCTPSSPPAPPACSERLQAAVVKRMLSMPSCRWLFIPSIYSTPPWRCGFSPSPRAPSFPELSPGFGAVAGWTGHPAITGFAQLWENKETKHFCSVPTVAGESRAGFWSQGVVGWLIPL